VGGEGTDDVRGEAVDETAARVNNNGRRGRRIAHYDEMP